MNRTIVGVAAVLIFFGLALVSFPLWALGSEQFDVEQEIGILFLPFTLVGLLVGLTALDPLTTTVGGAFGNPEFDPSPAKVPSGSPRTRLAYDPVGDVHCPFCRTIITTDLTQCPRCGRARPCRSCERPLGLVLDRPTCPACARAEALCNCPPLPRRTSVPAASSRGRRIV
ncbi:MAG: hypothetical protein L3K02_05110 [Thermoplasmata archaeon]|nr:hypothetical protein [Thermoplasmata archaeon]